MKKWTNKCTYVQEQCSSKPRFWGQTATAAAKLLQSCLTLYDHIDGSPPGSSFPEILQARTLEWVAISFSNAWKWKVKVKSLSRVWLLATPWTVAYQAPLSMGFSRQEYWSGLPLPSLLRPDYLESNPSSILTSQVTLDKFLKLSLELSDSPLIKCCSTIIQDMTKHILTHTEYMA